MVVVLGGRSAAVVPAPGSDVYLATENRLYTTRPRMIMKDDGREQIAVLGNRHRWHMQLDGVVEQFVDSAGAVEQRVLSVQMQVDEVGHLFPIRNAECGMRN
jgi:hypothetical protein